MTLRVHYLKTAPSGRAAIVIGVVLMLAAIGVLVVAVVKGVLGTAGGTMVVGVLALAACATAIFVIGWRRRQRASRLPADRLQRLDALLAHPDGAERFPHRAVERYLRKPPLIELRSRLEELLKACPPGTILLVNSPSPFDVPPPRPHDIPFEPVELDDDEQRLELLRMGYGDDIPDALLPPRTRAKRRKTSQLVAHLKAIKPAIQKLLLAAWFVFLAASTTWSVYRAVQTGRWWDVDLMMLAFLALITFGLLYALMCPTSFWLVPGGLVWWTRWLFGSREDIMRFEASEFVLLHEEQKLRLLAKDGREVAMNAGVTEVFTLLCAWFSEARPPTQDELESFFRGRQDDDEESARNDDVTTRP